MWLISGWSHSRPEDPYGLVPSTAESHSQFPKRRPSHLRRRYVQITISAVLAFVVSVGLWISLVFNGYLGMPVPILHALSKESGLPPLYSRFHEYELQLPQHSLAAEDQVKYFWISNHVRGNGWGNVMQELLLDSYLAYRAGRSFVFDNYTWTEGVSDYALYNLKPIPSRIPLSALIRGPTVGAPFASDPDAPRAVMKEFWDQVCPNPQVIKNDDIVASLGGRTATAGLMVEKWVELLRATDDRCVEVPRDSWPIFDTWILQDADRLLDAWPEFSRSPILTEFGWSPLVELAFDTNRELFSPSSVAEPYLSSVPFTNSSAERYIPIPGLLALHIRRGDFVRHCKRLAGWESKFVGYNAFPSLPDQQDLPSDATSQSRIELYRLRCYPEIDEIVKRVDEIRRTEEGAGLKNIYIMTNGPAEWIRNLEDALRKSWQWSNIASSKELLVNQEQEYIKQAVDILIGQRAQVFIGNAFSSLTGQVVMLRMANDFSPDTSRLW